jgi:hypothetical protein
MHRSEEGCGCNEGRLHEIIDHDSTGGFKRGRPHEGPAEVMETSIGEGRNASIGIIGHLRHILARIRALRCTYTTVAEGQEVMRVVCKLSASPRREGGENKVLS